MTKSDIIDFYFIFGLDGLYDRQQMLVACRHILQKDAVVNRLAICQGGTHGEVIKHPSLHRIIFQNFRIVDVVPVFVLSVALDDDTEHYPAWHRSGV